MSRTILAAAVIAMATQSASPGQLIYWTNNSGDAIERSELDGSNGTTVLQTERPKAIALDAQTRTLFWGDASGTARRIRSLSLVTLSEQEVITGLDNPEGIAIDPVNDKLYWTDSGTGKVQRANLDGTNIEDLVATGPLQPQGITLDLDSGKMYWADLAAIHRANLDGTGVEDLITPSSGVRGLAINRSESKLYWIDAVDNVVRRANFDGTLVEVVVGGLASPEDVEIDANEEKVYWADGFIRRANLDGSNVEQVSTSDVGARGVVIDQGGPGIIYVDDTATGANDGSTWCDAFIYLQDALATAEASGGTVTEIRVAQGTYKPDQGANVTPGDRTASFNLVDGVALRGGYGGCSAADPDERDILAHESILSGDLNDNDIPVACTSNSPDCDLFGRLCVNDFCIISGNNVENSYHVVTGSGTDSTAIVDAFAITAGNANGSDSDRFGGGLYTDNSTIIVTNCTISGNSAALHGGGMHSDSSIPQMSTCLFIGNSAAEGGGGMRALRGSPTLSNCIFVANSAAWGGGLATLFANATMSNCVFEGNSAESGGGLNNGGGNPTVTGCTFSQNSARSLDGGGMYNINNISLSVTNSTFSGNTASGNGGGMLNQENGSLTVASCTFDGNTANSGGGMMNSSNGNSVLTDCTFSENSVVGAGGGIYCHRSDTHVTSCKFVGNSADGFGGGFYSHESNSDMTNCILSRNISNFGGGIYFENSLSPIVTDCTFNGNIASQQGGGMYFVVTSSPPVTNSILWDNSDASGSGESAQIHVETGWPDVNYSVVQGGWSGMGGLGVIDVDPFFVDPLGPDGMVGTFDDDLRLMPGSPAIDAGNNTTVPADEFDLDNDGDTTEPIPFDLDGNPRFKDDPLTPDTGVGTPPIVDMGAYEYQRGCLTDPDCDNLDPCDGIETCVDSVCEPGTAIVCDDDDPCNGIETCNESGDCVALFDTDCNGNSIEDACDIAGGATDANSNGIPDECELGACCAPDGVCLELLQIECLDSWTVGLACDQNPCAFLTGVEVLGCRYMGITPNPTADPDTPIALRVQRLDEACPTKYVTIDSGIGRLADLPVYQSTSAWGTIEVADAESVPSGTYEVRTQTASDLSSPVVVVLRKWGDVIAPFGGSGQPNFADITAIVDCFKETANAPPLSACDIHPAVPDQMANFADITAGVDAFKGTAYPGSPCP